MPLYSNLLQRDRENRTLADQAVYFGLSPSRCRYSKLDSSMRVNDLPTDGEPNIKDSSLSLRLANLIHPTLKPSPSNPTFPATDTQNPYRRYSLDYVEQEADAQAARRGIWAGEFMRPWEWRRGKRLDTGD